MKPLVPSKDEKTDLVYSRFGLVASPCRLCSGDDLRPAVERFVLARRESLEPGDRVRHADLLNRTPNRRALAAASGALRAARREQNGRLGVPTTVVRRDLDWRRALAEGFVPRASPAPILRERRGTHKYAKHSSHPAPGAPAGRERSGARASSRWHRPASTRRGVAFPPASPPPIPLSIDNAPRRPSRASAPPGASEHGPAPKFEHASVRPLFAFLRSATSCCAEFCDAANRLHGIPAD